MKRIGKDKWYHLIAGFVVAVIVTVLITPFWGLVAGLAAGLAKDVIWDWKLGKGQFEILDIWFTVLGAVLGTAGGLLVINYIIPLF